MAKLISLSVTQLAVLLKGAGYQYVSGFAAEIPALDDQSVIQALHTLSNCGFITSTGEGFEMAPAIKAAVNRIGKAERLITLHTSDGRLPDKCIYPGDELLVCTLRPYDSRHLSLCFTSAEELFAQLCDEGYLPTARSEELFDEEDLLTYEQDIAASGNTGSCVLLSLDVMSRDSTQSPNLKIIDYYFYNYICCFDGNKVIREPYSLEAYQKAYERMMTG